MASTDPSWPGISWKTKIAVCFFIAIAAGWLFIAIPTLIGVGWTNTSSKASSQSLADTRTAVQNGFAQQNNAVQANYIASTQLPSGTVNIGGTNGVANALPFVGDVTLSPNGQTRIGQGAVTNSQLANPTQYIVSTFPADLPPVPIWRNSLTSGFDTGTLLSVFPFSSVNFAATVVTRNVPSGNSTPTVDVDAVLINASNKFQLVLTAANVLQLILVSTSAVIVASPVPASVANRAIWTVYTFSQQWSPAGWIYAIYADNLLLASVTTVTPLSANSNVAWTFAEPPTPTELANAFVFVQPDQTQTVITTQDLARLVILGPGNTFSSQLNSTLFAAYELYNTPGYPAVVSGTIVQSLPVGASVFKPSTAVAGLAWSQYQNKSLAMLQPSRISSLLVDFTMPGNVTTVTVTILIETVIPYNCTPPSSATLSLTLYGSTIAQDSFVQQLQVDPSVSEQTLVVQGISTTSNTDIGQKWTVELVRDDTLSVAPDVFWIGVRSFVVQGVVP